MSRDIAQEVADSIIAQLEKGTVPWRKPWNVGGLMPTSLQTGKAYQGINSLILTMIMQDKGYDRNLWATYKQAQALGGNVKKGEKSTLVVYWSKVNAKAKEEGDKARSFMMLKFFHVFNVNQCENLTIPAKYDSVVSNPLTIGEAVTKIWDGYPNRPILNHQVCDSANYRPSLDVLTLPPIASFPTEVAYAETLFHEMTHSTGHESRVNRFKEEGDAPRPFGSPVYAREELVAELGAVMLAGHAGLEFDLANSAAYVENWLSALKNDKNLIIQASQRANKAVQYILGKTESEEVEAGA